MELDLSNLKLKSLPKIPEGITVLKCNNNKLTKIGGDDLPESLLELYCSDNKLTILKNLPKNLVKLECKNNYISNIYLPVNTKIVLTKYQKCLVKTYRVADMFVEPVIHFDWENTNMNVFSEGVKICNEEFDFM